MPEFADIEGLVVTENMAAAFQLDGIEHPNPVQQEAIPTILAGRNTVLLSGTGTGKTLAYLLPLLQRLEDPASGRVVIITPATELAMQIARTAQAYKSSAITVATATASTNKGRQQQRLTQSTRLIIGTPGRILELYAARKMKGVRTMVLDEPDPILNSQHGAFLREVLSRPEPQMQLILASATLGPSSETLINERMASDHTRIAPTQTPLHTHITHS